MCRQEPTIQHTVKEEMRLQAPFGEGRHLVVSAICADGEGKRVAFSAHASLPLQRGLVQLPGVTWYAVVDVLSKKLIVSGPRHHEVTQRVEDDVIGWFSHHLVIVRNRLLQAGTPFPPNVNEFYKVLDREVNVITVSNKGDEQFIRRYTCPYHSALQPVSGAFGYLGKFHLCRHHDCLVFTEDKTVFRKERSLVRKGQWITVPDFSRSKQVVHRLHLPTGKDEVIGETPAGWRCEDVWYDCQSGKTTAVISLTREDRRVLGIASSKGASSMRVLGQVNEAWWGNLSPDGKLAVLVDGDANKDMSVAKVLRTEAPSVLWWKRVVPGWRRRCTWSSDGRHVLLWYPIWFHDKEHGSRYQRLYRGYRFWVMDIAGKKTYSVGPEWSGRLAVTWGADGRGLFVIANGTLGYLSVGTGKLSFIWSLPSEWY